MNNEKVYLKGYVVGHSADTLGYKGLQIQLENMDIVEVDKNLVYKNVDEPQKPVVPQFVAEWYEKHKDSLEFCIWDYVYRFDMQEDTSFKEWFNEPKTEPFQTLVNMHQFGYTVEKEKRYMVKLKAVDQYLVRNEDENFLGFLQSRLKSKFTRKQLEQAELGWVFDCEGIEIEEVE